MEFSIISPCFGKAKIFSDNSNLQTWLTFSVSMKTANESYVFLMGFILCLETLSCFITLGFFKNLSSPEE